MLTVDGHALTPCAGSQFAATACTIVSGAIAERARFEAYILYSLFMAAWVYPILTHSGTAAACGLCSSSTSLLHKMSWQATSPSASAWCPASL